jgi:hypothetical protein
MSKLKPYRLLQLLIAIFLHHLASKSATCDPPSVSGFYVMLFIQTSTRFSWGKTWNGQLGTSPFLIFQRMTISWQPVIIDGGCTRNTFDWSSSCQPWNGLGWAIQYNTTPAVAGHHTVLWKVAGFMTSGFLTITFAFGSTRQPYYESLILKHDRSNYLPMWKELFDQEGFQAEYGLWTASLVLQLFLLEWRLFAGWLCKR